MAVTITFDSPRSRNVRFSGSEKVRRGTGNLGTGYTTGGIPITPAMFGLRTLENLDITAAPGIARFFIFDKTAMKVRCDTALATEAAAASDQSAQTFRFQAQGS